MKKKQSLNGIRGIMAVAIFLSHCGWVKYFEQTKNTFQVIYYLYGAVTFFFVLSGFFFEYTAREESFFDCIKRKIKKIYPIHFLTLICSICLLTLQGRIHIKQDVSVFTANLFLVQAWIPNERYYFSFNAVSWYLSALLVCYILGYFIRKYVKRIEWIIVIGYAIQIMLCIRYKETQHWLLYINPLFRTVDFCLGIKICQLICNYKAGLQKSFYTIGEGCSLLLFAMAVIGARYVGVNWTYMLLFIVPVFMMIIFFAVEEGAISKVFKMKCFQHLGSISLELFMTHKFIVNNLINYPAFIKLASKHAYLAWVVLFVLCIALAYFTHFVLELVTKRLVWRK